MVSVQNLSIDTKKKTDSVEGTLEVFNGPLSLVFGFRNRDVERVQRCLDSLCQQSFQDFKVIFVDYGSDTIIAKQAQQCVKQFSFCRYVYTDMRGRPWNRSHALNTGVKLTKTPYVMTSDVDMVFSPTFIETVIDHLTDEHMFYCYPYYLPADFTDWNNLAGHRHKLKPGNHNAKGGCQVVSTKLFASIGGFDEYYRYWGIEDRDINHRLKSLGLEEVWLNGKTEMYHQWHPPVDVKTAGFMPDNLWPRMQNYYYRHLDQPKRNCDEWGKLYTIADRPIYQFLDFEKCSLVKNESLHFFKGSIDNSRDVGDFVRLFSELLPGHALVLEGTQFPKRLKSVDFVLRAVNRGLRQLDLATRVGYAPNLLHTFLDEHIEINSNFVADFFLQFPANGNYSLVMRQSQE